MEDKINKSLVQDISSVPEGVLKREKERIAALEKRNENKTESGKEFDGIIATFNENISKIKLMIEEIETLGEENKNVLKNKFADVNKQVATLNHYIVDFKTFLTLYDMKKYQTKLQDLTDEINALESKFLPRKKFGFKKIDKYKGQGDKLGDGTKSLENKEHKEGVKDETDFVKGSEQLKEHDIGFYDKKNETLELCNEDVHKKHVSISNIENCVIQIKGNASTVHMNNVRKSRVCVGPVSNSVFIDNCSDSQLFLACHQLRMHTSENCQVYLYVTSKAIIEHCQNIGFAPNIRVDETLLQMSGLERDKNHWDLIDDFNWLSVDEHSPNWFIIEESKRIEAIE